MDSSAYEREIKALRERLSQYEPIDPTIEEKEAIEWLHTVLCKRSHAGPERTCAYYMEDTLPNPWQCTDHLIWIEELDRLKIELGEQEMTPVLQAIVKVQEIMEQLHDHRTLRVLQRVLSCSRSYSP